TRAGAGRERAEDVGPAVADQVDVERPPLDDVGEVVPARALPAGLEGLGPFEVGGRVAAQVDRGGRALEDVEVLGVLAHERHALDRRGAGANYRDPLVGEAREAAVGVAAGVGVVPAVGVERVALEIAYAGDARQLGAARRPQRHDHEAGSDVIATAGGD